MSKRVRLYLGLAVLIIIASTGFAYMHLNNSPNVTQSIYYIQHPVAYFLGGVIGYALFPLLILIIVAIVSKHK
jgi:hypothetical protein